LSDIYLSEGARFLGSPKQQTPKTARKNSPHDFGGDTVIERVLTENRGGWPKRSIMGAQDEKSYERAEA